MLNKIIKDLEAKYKVASESQKYATDAETTDYYTGQCIGINEAISIIKQHESEFNHHPLSPEDIERAAKSHSDDRDSQMSFTEGANFAKQPHSNEVDEPIYCNCETPTLGTNLTRCGTCGEWFKRIV